MPCCSCSDFQDSPNQKSDNQKKNRTLALHSSKQIGIKSNEAIEYLKNNLSFNNQLFFLVDMKIPSNKYRFFVYSSMQHKVLLKGLVAHGSGSNTAIEDSLCFSNVEQSYCSSLGKYSIGNSYDGQFGKAYKLYGLDKTNSHAFERNIVLHRYYKVPYNEQEDEICNSLGCPMVSPTFFNQLEPFIDKSDKPILLYIYY